MNSATAAMRDRYPALRIPIIIMAGSDDRIVSYRRHAVWLHANVTHSELRIVPGVGHIYRGRPFKGIMWFFFVSIAYGMGPPFGILIHMICAANAAFSGTLREDMLTR